MYFIVHAAFVRIKLMMMMMMMILSMAYLTDIRSIGVAKIFAAGGTLLLMKMVMTFLVIVLNIQTTPPPKLTTHTLPVQ